MDSSSSSKRPSSVHCLGQENSFIDFAAQDDAFLDSMSEMLQKLAGECSKALEWTTESEAITADAAEAFQSLVDICRHAGLAIADTEDDEQLSVPVIDLDTEVVTAAFPAKEPVGLAIEIPSPGFSDSRLSTRGPASTRPCAPANSEAWTPRYYTASPISSLKRVSSGDAQQYVASPVRREEIIEIELTDLLTHTHEEIELCRRELTNQLHQADTRHAEAQAEAHTDLQALQHTLESSQVTMSRIQQEVQDTRQNMTALQSSVVQSQQAMEAAMKDQARQWRAICNDLIVEKRNVAKKLAGERGKYAALKEHLTMHDNQRQSDKQRHSPHRKREMYNPKTSRSSRACSVLEPEDKPTAPPVWPSSPLPVASKKSSIDNDFELLHVDLYRNGDEAFLSRSAERSPSSPSLSLAGSVHSPIEAHSRMLKSSDLSTSPTSISGHRSRSSVASHSSSKKSDFTSPASPAVKLEPLSWKSSGTTASFRRYYLSSQQLPGVGSSRNSNNSSRPPHAADVE
ncbi:hypothetical protein Gpo141_00000554 [Globisporangium polare]